MCLQDEKICTEAELVRHSAAIRIGALHTLTCHLESLVERRVVVPIDTHTPHTLHKCPCRLCVEFFITSLCFPIDPLEAKVLIKS